MDRTFPATRAAGLASMNAVIPRMGRAYAAGRNADLGPDRETATSALSPYLRRRMLLESEVVDAALDVHGPQRAEKFIQEVFWRSYFKGHLETRPAIWFRYRDELAASRNRLATESGLRRVFEDAANGRTGIECFDDWARELVATNWLHNHTRMWFASIWIFTLRLPWVPTSSSATCWTVTRRATRSPGAGSPGCTRAAGLTWPGRRTFSATPTAATAPTA
jgi:deoxyribodipyrimidine photo-lyase